MTSFTAVADLKIGHVVEVSGTTVKIELSGDVSELTRTQYASAEGRLYGASLGVENPVTW